MQTRLKIDNSFTPIESSRNFSINTRDWEGNIENNLFLGHDKMEVLAHSLKIKDTHGAVIFSADKNEVMIGASSLRIDGDGGAVFRESVQTSVIRAEPGRELKYDFNDPQKSSKSLFVHRLLQI